MLYLFLGDDMIYIAVCDDDEHWAIKAEKMIRDAMQQRTKEPVSIDTYTNPLKLRDNEGVEYDALFLDVQMPDMEGFLLGDYVASLNPDVFLVYMTNFSSRVYDVFNHAHKYFLVKDTFQEQLKMPVKRFLELRDISIKYLFVGEKESIKIRHHDIYYVAACGNYVIAHTVRGEIKLHTSLVSIRDNLLSNYFGRISKGVIVNFQYVQDDSDRILTLKSGEKLEISRRCYSDFHKAYFAYMFATGFA